MANVDQYKLGYEEFKTKPNHGMEYIKQQHPLWRSGYRKAQQDFSKQNNLVLPNKLYDVQIRQHVYSPTWNDIMAATRRPRYKKLHSDVMKPVLYALIKAVEDQKESLTSYALVLREVDKAFDIILQVGFESGILNQKDLAQYDYEAK